MDKKFIINRQGKDFVLYEGLLHEAHERGLQCIDTTLLHLPTDENGQTAICKATVEMQDGRRFSGIGDAAPNNVNRMILPHIIRMAETRAKARALRDALDIGVTALEELGGSDEDEPAPERKSEARTPYVNGRPAGEPPIKDQIRLMIRDLVRVSGKPYEDYEKALIARAMTKLGVVPAPKAEDVAGVDMDQLAPDALEALRDVTQAALDKAKKTVTA